MKRDKKIIKELKTLLKNMIDKNDVHSHSVRFEHQGSMEPYKNLVQVILDGSGTITIEVTGEHVDEISELFARLEKMRMGH